MTWHPPSGPPAPADRRKSRGRTPRSRHAGDPGASLSHRRHLFQPSGQDRQPSFFAVLLLFYRDPPDGAPSRPIASPRETLFGASVLSGSARPLSTCPLAPLCLQFSRAPATHTPPRPRHRPQHQTCAALIAPRQDPHNWRAWPSCAWLPPRPRIGLDARRVIGLSPDAGLLRARPVADSALLAPRRRIPRHPTQRNLCARFTRPGEEAVNLAPETAPVPRELGFPPFVCAWFVVCQRLVSCLRNWPFAPSPASP